MPQISVVIPTYHRPQQLSQAIASALGQTFSDIEVVVALEQGDAASQEIVDAHPDARVRSVVNMGSRGPGPNRDSGISASRGEWVAFLDDDDEWEIDKLERQMALAASRGPAVISCQAHVITETSSRIMPLTPYDPAQPIDEWLFDRPRWFKARGSFAQTSTLMVPRSLLDHVRFGTSRHEDWEFVIRAVKQQGLPLLTVMTPLVRYKAGGTYVFQDSLMWLDEVRDLLTPRAYSGFCLTVATRALPAGSRLRSAWQLLSRAFQKGRPTGQQLLGFFTFVLLPGELRHQLGATLARARNMPKA